MIEYNAKKELEATEKLREYIIGKIKEMDNVALRNLMGWGPFISGVGNYEEGENLPEYIFVCPELGCDVHCVEVYEKRKRND